jgi:hypothetical protein
MPGKRRRSTPPPERLFYAPPPRWRAQWPVAFFAVVAILLGRAALSEARYAAPFAATSLLLAAGIYVNWRRRWPWLGPALRADAAGLVVNPDSARPAALPWCDVIGMIDDPSDHSIVFVPRDPADRVRHLLVMRRGPAVPRDIRTRDGVYFVDVIEDYWRMPKS